jgi:hypothetical protein
MKTRKKMRVSTPRGFARVLARGIRDNFDPEHQPEEAAKLVELFRDMAMTRDIITDANIAGSSLLERRLADSDSAWLDEIAAELEKMAFPI